MDRRLLAAALFAAAAAPSWVVAAAPARRPRQAAPEPALTVSVDTKLLVVAPHPDDETLGAGGLMQRVVEAGGSVRVIFLTDGDAYFAGVRYDEHKRRPKPGDYRDYGRRRQREARAALGRLGLATDGATFLSFPDRGLGKLMSTYWSERRAAFRSPYTRFDRPPSSEIIVPDTEYRGEDLTHEIARVIGEDRPTMILVPRKEDQHVDHCAAWFFLMDALEDIRRVDATYTPDVINYIVHWYSWPFEDDGPALPPPTNLRGGISGWMRVPLTPAQVTAKRAALKQYRTQYHVMGWFLDGFARTNEEFSRPAPARIQLPLRKNPC